MMAGTFPSAVAAEHIAVAALQIVTGSESEKEDRCLMMTDRREPTLADMSRIQGAPKKSNPLGKILYLWNCSRFFHQIYSVYRRGFRPHILQILLQ